MLPTVELTEYLEEIRKEVCARCIERPPGGPPCAALGKLCGVELHLRELIDIIHEVDSPLLEPYLEHNRCDICQHCAYLHSSICPCPMDYLVVPLVQAVEAVDERREQRDRGRRLVFSLPGAGRAGISDIARAYEAATGRWTGCDWPTQFGRTGLDLNGRTTAEAETLAVESMSGAEAEDWGAAATWLTRIEAQAALAEAQAALAVAAANAGEWPEAVGHARRARSLEFSSGRTIHRARPLTWSPLYRAVLAAAHAARGA